MTKFADEATILENLKPCMSLDGQLLYVPLVNLLPLSPTLYKPNQTQFDLLNFKLHNYY
jgi:hypothetical protein